MFQNQLIMHFYQTLAHRQGLTTTPVEHIAESNRSRYHLPNAAVEYEQCSITYSNKSTSRQVNIFYYAHLKSIYNIVIIVLKVEVNDENPPNTQETKIIFGRDEIDNLFVKSISEIGSSWNLIGGAEGPSLFYYMTDLKKAYLKALKRGLNLRAITVVTKDNIFYARDALKYFSEVRHLEGIVGTFVVSDKHYFGTSMMLYNEGKVKIEEGISKPQYPAELCILSTSKELIYQQQKFFNILWDQAIPAEEKIREIEKLEAPQLKSLDNPFEIQNLLINLLQSVHKDIWLLVSSYIIFEDIQRFSNIFTILQSFQKKKEVRILILTTNDTQKQFSEKTGFKAEGNFEIRYIDYTGLSNFEVEANTLIAIFDRNKSLAIRFKERKENTLDSFSKLIESSVYTVGKDTVMASILLFERLWYQTKLIQNVKDSVSLQKEFVNLAAHELRNPIQPILGLSKFVLDNIKDDEQKEMLNIIVKNVTKLMHITNDIIDLARIEEKILVLNKEKLDLYPYLLNLINEYQTLLLDNNHIELEFKCNNKVLLDLKDFAKGKPKEYDKKYSEISADRFRLSQILYNLIDNANKFTSSGIIKILVEIDEDEVIFSIIDKGTGIDKEILPKLFTKFTTKSFQGTGLGLYICRNIVEAHGGKIWAENNPEGKGATFSFSLPTNQN
jgi:two-component system, OmpR family, sensor histidine kinase VicK